MKTNLIIVEGMPGSGKSTTAAMIADALRNVGRTVVCVDEGDPDHPADIADYDFPDFETEREQILAKWREFVSQADRGTVYVFNCIFLQNPMCETMMRFGMPESASRDYIAEIAEIIAPLHLCIIYLDSPDVRASVDAVLAERGQEWLQFVIDYHVNQGYGLQQQLSGYEGYIKCLEERRQRELRILQTLEIGCYTVRPRPSAAELLELLRSEELL